jgi:CheY-like chemotaxis protein
MPPAPSDLEQRAWIAYLAQELAAPAAGLVQHARPLAEVAKQTNDPHTIITTHRIGERADALVTTVHRLTRGEIVLTSDDDRRTLRHDLRGAAGYVVSACDDLSEGSTAELLSPHLANTRAAAAQLLGLIGSLRDIRTAEGSDSKLLSDIRDTLASLPAAVARATADADRTEPARLLLVDDNEYHRDLVAKALQALGHQVETASGGNEAMQRLTDGCSPTIDLILCDLLMPGVTGIDLLKWLKSDPVLWPIPVIMVSALGDEDGALACISAGAEDYLTRPVKPELLRARIAGGLEKKRLRDREQAYQSRIDRLVRAIFPPAAVDEWRQNEAIRPRRYEKVGVLFTDIAGFTAWCESRRDHPEEVVATLQDLIGRFELSAQRHGVQKIKTIGDAFMAVAGLSELDPNPALTLLKFGLDVIADVRCHPTGWLVRVGVHVGPVVTGVLGQTQFTFDVWGHTVNVAARMESNGVAGLVTLSEEAWADVTTVADGTPRTASVKGLGDITVWDVTKLKPTDG